MSNVLRLPIEPAPFSIGTAITSLHSLRLRALAADAEGRGDDGHRFDMKAEIVEDFLRTELDKLLGPHGATIDQVVRALS